MKKRHEEKRIERNSCDVREQNKKHLKKKRVDQQRCCKDAALLPPSLFYNFLVPISLSLRFSNMFREVVTCFFLLLYSKILTLKVLINFFWSDTRPLMSCLLYLSIRASLPVGPVFFTDSSTQSRLLRRKHKHRQDMM